MRKITVLVLMLFTTHIYAQGIELNGTISAEDNQIKNLQDPTEAQDAVTLSVLLEKISALQDQIDNAQIGSITDVDGNTYNSLTYGNQVWTVENAEMVTYRDGTGIPQVTEEQRGQPSLQALGVITVITKQKESFIIGMQ